MARKKQECREGYIDAGKERKDGDDFGETKT